MEINLKQLFEGWRNHLLPPEKLKELIETTSDERLKICEQCENYSTKNGYKHCAKCGCSFPAKTKCLSCKCPIDKWAAILSEVEEKEIKNQIK